MKVDVKLEKDLGGLIVATHRQLETVVTAAAALAVDKPSETRLKLFLRKMRLDLGQKPGEAVAFSKPVWPGYLEHSTITAMKINGPPNHYIFALHHALFKSQAEVVLSEQFGLGRAVNSYRVVAPIARSGKDLVLRLSTLMDVFSHCFSINPEFTEGAAIFGSQLEEYRKAKFDLQRQMGLTIAKGTESGFIIHRCQRVIGTLWFTNVREDLSWSPSSGTIYLRHTGDSNPETEKQPIMIVVQFERIPQLNGQPAPFTDLNDDRLAAEAAECLYQQMCSSILWY